MKQYLSRHRTAFCWSILCMLTGVLLVSLSRSSESFGQWYATHLYPIFPNTLGRLLSPLPFSAAEIGLYTLMLAIPCTLIFLAASAIRRSGSFARRLSACFLTALCLGSGMFLMLTLICSINYDRDPFAQIAGLSITASSHQELELLCKRLIGDANVLSSQVPVDDRGLFTLAGADVKKDSIAAMKKLGETYSELSGYYPRPKPILLSRGMSYLNLTGIFSAFTVEANYNQDVLDYLIPYTICHELAHLKGFIKEEEAGFISYLACRDADSITLRYSAALNALSYALNAYGSDSTEEEYRSMYTSLSEQVRRDFSANHRYWDQVSGTVSQIATAANDTYLKANAQVDGIKSYGRMVDLLLAYYDISGS